LDVFVFVVCVYHQDLHMWVVMGELVGGLDVVHVRELYVHQYYVRVNLVDYGKGDFVGIGVFNYL